MDNSLLYLSHHIAVAKFGAVNMLIARSSTLFLLQIKAAPDLKKLVENIPNLNVREII